MKNAIPITPENCVEVCTSAVAFALGFHNNGSGTLRDIDWIDGEETVGEFVQQTGLNNPYEDEPITVLQQLAFLKTVNGKIYFFHVAESQPGQPGLATLAGGHCITGIGLHDFITGIYNLSVWIPADESAGSKATVSAYEEDAAAFETAIQANQKKLDQSLGKLKAGQVFRLLFWGDKDGSTSNKVFCKWFEANHVNSIAVEALGMNNIVSVLQSIAKLGHKTGQIIMSVHGTFGCFKVDKYNKPFNGPSVCGLYQEQVTPANYAGAVAPYCTDHATVTLLSCKTAGVDGVDGKVLMYDISNPLSGYVIASDDLVFMQPNNSYTYGNIYRSTPVTPVPAVYIVGGAAHNMPLQMF